MKQQYNCQKGSILRVFILVTYKNAKMHGKYPLCGYEGTLLDMRIKSAFELLRLQNVKTHE